MHKLFTLLIAVLLALGLVLTPGREAKAAGELTVEIRAGYNLVVDSNVLSPSSYAPSVATVIGMFCNVGDDRLTNVNGYIGDFDPNGDYNISDSTAGVYPARDSSTVPFQTQHPHLANSGLYAFTHIGGRLGTLDAGRFIDVLEPGECQAQYWHFTYPRRENPANTGPDPVFGATSDPIDDLWLQFDVWGTSTEDPSSSATWTMTMRSEISAMANKIKPNPDGDWFNTADDIVLPGQTVTTNGINYELGVINKGFDNDGDFVPDYNAWLQPVGDPSFDPSCFRLVKTAGVLYVSRSGGQPDMTIPFEDQLYFTDLPDDNTGVRGEVFYTFIAGDGNCSTTLTPYQEAASGYDNEKFAGDYGAVTPVVGTYTSIVTIEKSSAPLSVPLGTNITYSIPVVNADPDGMGISVGRPDLGMGLTVQDRIPVGLQYVAGSADYIGYGDTDPANYTILFSTNNGLTWTATEPVPASSVTDIQWRLNVPLPALESGTASFSALLPNGYIGAPVIENTACTGFGGGWTTNCDTAVNMVRGINQIGDFVWDDTNADGMQTGELANGINNISVRLYWDRGTIGVLDANDLLITTQDSRNSGSNGYYNFAQLPDALFLVQVDTADPDLPGGYFASTAAYYAVNLNSVGDIIYATADFGFAPTLGVQKTQNSSNPAYEGELVTYAINLANNRPGDGSGQPTYCEYTVWATIDHPDQNYVPPGGNNAQSRWLNTPNARFAPDGQYAVADIGNNVNLMGLSGFQIGPQLGTVTNVEMLLYMTEIVNLQAGDRLVYRVWYNNAQISNDALYFLTGSGYFTQPAGYVYVFRTSIENLRHNLWRWSDFTTTNLSEMQFAASKTGNNPGDLGLDAAAYVITTDQFCGGTQDTITYLPLTDTYDPAKLEFVSASPVETGVNGGVITWDNLGPLYAGQTLTVNVTFRALQPPDNDGDGENDATTVDNCAEVNNAELPDGTQLNPPSSCVTTTINPTGSIGDTIWNDNGNGGGTPNNGIQDGGEAGIAGVTVWLCTTTPCGSANAIQTVVTDAAGHYLFTALRDGTYYMTVDTASLPGTTFTQTGDPDGACPGANCNNSSQATINNNNGNSSDDNNLTRDFGYRVPNAIYGNVWEDNNGDTNRQNGENNLQGATVRLYNCGIDAICGNADDQVVQTQVTPANGNYSFGDLPDGTFYVVVDPSTVPGGGTWSNTRDPEGPYGDNRLNPLAVSGGNVYGSYDFGYHRSGIQTLSGLVYGDWNANLTHDIGEEGFTGVTVNLYEDSNGDGVIDPANDALIATTTTDSTGAYSFDSLHNGNYIVDIVESTLPDQYNQTEDPDPAVDGKGSVSLSGSGAADVNFGYRPAGTGSIGDLVWQDNDHDGLRDAGEPGIVNITVNLLADMNSDGNFSVVATALTDANGNYSFGNLPPGIYRVDVDQTDPDLPDDSYGQSYLLSTDNDLLEVILAAGQDYLEADFGFTAGGIIGDTVWQDIDGDGTQDSGEPGVNGVANATTVTLYRNGNLWATTTVDASGHYQFTSLPAGDFRVVVTTPSGYPANSQTGDPDASDVPCVYGDPDYGCNNESNVSLVLGQIDRSQDFGYRQTGNVGDTLWIDANGDRLRDATEAGLANVSVELWRCGNDGVCGTGDDSIYASTVTDVDGNYSFGSVPNGLYQVRVVTTDPDFPASLIIQTYDPDEPGQVCTVCDSRGQVQVSGGSYMDLDFGYQLNGNNQITGLVFHDNDSDGVRDPEDTIFYEGVTVYLYRNGLPVGTTETGPGGTYSFLNLPDGTYTVSINPDAPNLLGTVMTTPTFVANIALDPTSTNPNPVSAVAEFGAHSSLDFGDLSVEYNLTILDFDGARHFVPSSVVNPDPPRLGSIVDTEPNGIPNLAVGDDLAGVPDDEDGVSPTPNISWARAPGGGSIDVTVNGCPVTLPCYVSGWINWNVSVDYDFNDPGEQILVDQLVTNGTQTIVFDIPIGATFTTVYARFRLYPDTTNGFATPNGYATGGEAEDFEWKFTPTAVTLLSLEASTESGLPYLWLAVAGAGLVGVSALFILRFAKQRRRV